MSKHVIHQHSSVADKRPSASSLEYGEIAVNYASGKEAVMLKNTENAVVTISSDVQNDSKFATKTEISGLSSQITVIEDNITVISGQMESIGECSHVGEVYPGSTSGEVFNDYGANIASGGYSHAEGSRSEAYGAYSHAEGCNCVASGPAAHAEGSGSSAYGAYSHAEGNSTSATGTYSHAEGYLSLADGYYSHAEGRGCVASNDGAHAEGRGTSATSLYAHAEGYNTVASNSYEHACGRFNKSTESNIQSAQTRFSIGIGGGNTSRRNAIEAKSNGDVYIYGVGGFDGKNDADDDVLPLSKAIPAIVVTSALPSTLASDTIYFIY